MDMLQRGQVEKILSLASSLARPIDSAEDMRSYGGFLDMPSRDVKKYSLLRAIKTKYESVMSHAGGFGGPTFSGVEAEAHEELCKRFGPPSHQGRFYVPADILCRDLTAASPTGGGHLVGTSNRSFIDLLRNFSAAFRLGVQRFPGLRENVTLPRQTGGATVNWLSSESAQATESGLIAFDQVTGEPHTAAAYVEISRQLLLQSDPGAEFIVSRGLAADVAVAADYAVFAGVTTNNEPQGIIGTIGVGTSISGATLNYSGLVQAQKDIADLNAVLDPGSLGYITTPTVAEILKGRQRFTGTDSPLWRGAIHQGEIEGVVALSSRQIPAGTLIHGDFSQAVVCEWGVLSVEVNPFAHFQAGVVGVRAMYSLDVLILQPASFTVISSIT
jgi:HK97 family phage major capsid protein